MTDDLFHGNPTQQVITLIELFVSTMDTYRPGARFIMTVTDEAIMVAFGDHGGAIHNETLRISSGPGKPHPSNPGWTPPTWQPARVTVRGETGDVAAEVPPILWMPGPGSDRRSIEATQRHLSVAPDIIEIEGGS